MRFHSPGKKNSVADTPEMGGNHNFSLGSTLISRDLVVFSNLHSVVFVNPSPFLPGHIVVAPLNSRRRLCDFTRNECIDLFLTVKAVVSSLSPDCDAFTIYMQDDACTDDIEHAHVHIIPRKKGDIHKNDDIYKYGALKVVGSGTSSSHLREYADILRKKLGNSRLQ